MSSESLHALIDLFQHRVATIQRSVSLRSTRTACSEYDYSLASSMVSEAEAMLDALETEIASKATLLAELHRLSASVQQQNALLLQQHQPSPVPVPAPVATRLDQSLTTHEHLPPISESEWNSIRPDIRGRLTLAGINQFLMILRQILTLKQQLLCRPRKKLSRQELQKFDAYLMQDMPETRGRPFFTDIDLAGQVNSATTKAMLALFKHTRRIRQHRRPAANDPLTR